MTNKASMARAKLRTDDRSAETGPSPDGRETARMAHLHYVYVSDPGYTRLPSSDGFIYRDANGLEVTDEAVLLRLKKLAIPPAYKDVWISADPRGHLQAVGRDVRGRKQYRYHPDWRAVRDEAKYSKMLVFGKQLPLLRAQVKKDLGRQGLPRVKVVATVVALLEKTLARIGNDEYTKTNKSFGLTTLRNRHAHVSGRTLQLDFRAKHGIQQHIEINDRRLAKIVGRLQDIKGQELFQYIDETGTQHAISSNDVNSYLQEVTGEEITAKDFRTWAATNLAALALHEFEQFDTHVKAKKNVLRAIETVSKLLGNTPAICRKCYIHPAVFEGYMDGTLAEALKGRAEAALASDGSAGLRAEEVAVMAFLAQRLSAAG